MKNRGRYANDAIAECNEWAVGRRWIVAVFKVADVNTQNRAEFTFHSVFLEMVVLYSAFVAVWSIYQARNLYDNVSEQLLRYLRGSNSYERPLIPRDFPFHPIF